MKKLLYIVFSIVILFTSCKKKTILPYQNPELSIEERVTDLLSRMSLEQKVSQLNYESKEIDSNGVKIPKYNWWNECLHGVARSGIATVYPQAIGMAASFDKELMKNFGEAVSDEGRAKYHDFVKRGKRGIYQGLTFWTPNINIFRDPRWGRGMETYGEDPYLSGSLAVEFINAMQGNDTTYLKTIATAKHFAVHSGPEPDRHSFNIDVNDYDLRETYLPAFKMCVEKAKVYSVMCAYNRFRDKPCCGSSPLLNDILRKEWKFNGYVVSDCWAIVDFYNGHNVVKTKAEAAAMAFKNGTDLNCGSTSPFLTEAVKLGLIKEAEIDSALKKLLIARFKLGMFDPDERVAYSKIPYSVVDSKEHQNLSLEAAKKSMVLLKNTTKLLPLKKDIKSIAVIGPNANDIEVLLANYNGIPSNPITPLQGIIAKLPNAQINYAMGCEHAANLPTFETVPSSVLFTSDKLDKKGFNVEYFDTAGFNRKPVFSGIDTLIDFYWWDKAPKEGLDDDNFAIRWSGYIVPKVSGKYALGAEGKFAYRFYVNDSLFVRFNNEHHALKNYEFIELEANKAYKIKIEFYHGNGDAGFKMLWATPAKNYEQEAIEAVKKSEVAVLFMGLSPRLEGEEMKVEVEGFKGGDRLTLDIPKLQQDFIKKIVAIGKPVVLVLLNGSAISINWEAANISAILEAWYPGQSAGTAIADVLFGDYNPAGRLPVTFYKSVNDLPDFKNYDMKGRTYRYFEKEPLFAFGYGLSYTSFKYSNLKLEKAEMKSDEKTTISIDVTNTGALKGDEVVQLYIKDVVSKDPRPIKTMKGYDRISLEPGQTKTVTFKLSSEELAYWNIDKASYIVEPGEFKIMIGSSSLDKDLQSISLKITE